MASFILEKRNNSGGWEPADPELEINGNVYSSDSEAWAAAHRLSARLAEADGQPACAIYRRMRVRDLNAQQPEFMTKMDWPLLRQQKLTLLRIRGDYPVPPVAEVSAEQYGVDMDHLEGLINGLDAIQDYAVDVMGLSDELVFGAVNEEGEHVAD